MPVSELTFRAAVPADAAPVRALILRSYRGKGGEAGWTSEAGLLSDERIDVEGVAAKITAPRGLVLLADRDGGLVACCELVLREPGLAYFGMFAVEPAAQAGGIGRQVLAEAERTAVRRWQATVLEMTVIGQRTELIDWYVRRGYERTGEHRPFPYHELINGEALRDDLYFTVLSKNLGPAVTQS